MLRRNTLIAVALAVGVCESAGASCPATVRIDEQVVAPPGWQAHAADRQASFLRASVLNGKPEGPEYDLAPTSSVKGQDGKITQVWTLAPYRDMNLFLRCYYRATESVLTIDLRADVQACTFQFRLDAKGNFVGPSLFTCR